MTGWFPCALAALLLMGGQRFLYKVTAERSCDTAWTTLAFMATVTVISAGAFLLGGRPVPDGSFLLITGLVNSLAFLLATVTHIEALKRLPATVAYPLIRLDVVLVVIISLGFFQEQLDLRQGSGLVLALAAALLVAWERGRGSGAPQKAASGYLFVAAAILAGAAAAVSSRYAAIGTDKSAFMAVSYGLSTLFVGGFTLRPRQRPAPAVLGESLRIGFVMGIINVVGYYAYLEALTRGPLSLVTVITGMHFVVAVFLSLLLYRERPTPLRLVGIGLTVLSLFLLRG
jgi:drug/metabolite transporter (DMT)-like permease